MMHSRIQVFVFLLTLMVGAGPSGHPAVVQAAASSDAPGDVRAPARVLLGRPLDYWVSQTTGTTRAEDLNRIVEALSEAVRSEDPGTKVAAADALAVLGPGALPAVPALLEQLDHVQPWVREAAAGALGAVGKPALPALLETFEKNAAVRMRVAFLLGAMGPEAQEAVPVLATALEKESPVNRARLAGILNQIDPARFAGETSRHPLSEQVKLGPGDEAGPDTFPGAGEWPQFHGPGRDSLCRERGLLSEWSATGPKLLWSIKGLGRGLSSLSIAGGRIFTMGDRPVGDKKEAQFVTAYDLENHQPLWATRVGPAFETGPRCTPTVDGDFVYALGTEGDLLCLRAATGEVCWRKNLATDFGGKMMSGWKYSESPLVDGERLICTPGAADAMLVALDKRTGAAIWKAAVPKLGAKGADGAAYSSVVAGEIAGVRQYVQLVGRGVVGVEAATGRHLWGYNRVANNVANITTPVVRGSYVFATTAYNTGSALLKIQRDGDGFRAEEVYFLGPRDFANHHGGVVLVGAYLYGGHGTNLGEPTCVALATGEICWKGRSPARGSACVLYADGHLIFRYDRGDLVLVEASPEAFRVKGRFRPLTGAGPAWAHPVIHRGKLYLRHEDLLCCYDLRAYD
jgi:outer membrane protein assembly factor BamB